MLGEVKYLPYYNVYFSRIKFQVLQYIVKFVCRTDDHHNALK